MRPASIRRSPAFTLIELVAVCAVIGILAALALPAIGAQIAQSRVAAETAALGRLADAVRATFESTDLEGTNIAVLPGSMPAGVDSTGFSSSTDPTAVPATTNTYDWFAKLTRQRGGVPIVGVAPTAALQPQAASVLINPNRLCRIFLAGPTTEANQQRFLLISLMAPAGSLALPVIPSPSNPQDPATIALFNDTWNTDWTNPASILPPSWVAGLTPTQAQAWQGGSGNAGRMWQLCVERILCPKYNLVINNNHPSDNCYLYYNFNGTTAGASASVTANSGVSAISGIFSGRTIQAYRGTAPPPSAQLFAQFVLRDSSEITVQD